MFSVNNTENSTIRWSRKATLAILDDTAFKVHAEAGMLDVIIQQWVGRSEEMRKQYEHVDAESADRIVALLQEAQKRMLNW